MRCDRQRRFAYTSKVTPTEYSNQELDTFPKLLAERARVDGDRPAMREKEFGIWQTWNWREVREEVNAFAAGLHKLGLQRGDRILIVGDNRPRLYWTMAAAQTLGSIPVPAYQDAVAEEIKYVIEHAGAHFVVVEDQEQVDKILEVKDECPGLKEIIFDDSRGLRNYERSHLHDFAVVQDQGREVLKSNPGFIDGELEKGEGSDISIILYTSGTTGKPKGVVLSHNNILITAKNSVEGDGLSADEDIVAYLPMAWVGDHVFSYGQSYVTGFCVNCPESGATVMQDMREIGPTYYFAPPRVFENLLTTVMIRMEDAGWIKRKMFSTFMDVARRVGTRILDSKSVSLADRLIYLVGNFLIYAPLRNTLGFSRVHLAYTAGEAIGPEIFDFYRSLGINLKQLYGQTEAAVFVTMQPNGEVRSDTVGTPAPGVEVQIAESGEVLYRSPGVFIEYYKNEKATQETKTAEGWVHTGDAGYIDDENHLRIIDRAKDVGKLNDGSMFAPKFLENKLKFFPQIKEAVTFGDSRNYATAFINIDLEAVASWAERKNIAYGSYQELAANSEVYGMIEECVSKVNADLALDKHLSSSQIKRFLILHKELDADDGELTRTRKVRRRIIFDKYQVLIDALYSEKDACFIETEVTFEDGRKGIISGNLEIRQIRD